MNAGDYVRPGGRRLRNGVPTRRVWLRLPEDLADWLEETADQRDVGANLLVVRALVELRRTLPPIPAGPDVGDLLEEATAALDHHR